MFLSALEKQKTAIAKAMQIILRSALKTLNGSSDHDILL
jgi:hypothetical protein